MSAEALSWLLLLIVVLVWMGKPWLRFNLRRRHILICREVSKLELGLEVLTDPMYLLAIVLPPSDTFGIVVALVIVTMRLWVDVRDVRRHADHEEDCIYGPKRRRERGKVRLPSWTKVSLNPAFAPT